jgi:SAM-dependent methyltransferase
MSTDNTGFLSTSFRARDCPVCGEPADKAVLFMRRSLDESRLTSHSFASRKTPEFMSYQMVRCRRCTTVFASEAPVASALAHAYHEADYNTAIEADFAAKVYRKYLEPYLARLPRRGIALEIGTGTGAFLRQLRELGFREPIGIEPSVAAVAAATADIRPYIREGVFTGDECPPASASLICCFQTLEHVPDPRLLVATALRMLEPGGMIALVTHDYSALLNRLLGRRSPIIDIEHVQLFCPMSLRYLVHASGYTPEVSRSIWNVYPLTYWLNLLPLPARLKQMARTGARVLHVADLPIALNVGNLLTVAQKPLAVA